MTAIVRAGAGIVITYAAADLADLAARRAMSADDQVYVQALALGLDPAWRRRSDEERHDDGCRFAEADAHGRSSTACAASRTPRSGSRPGVDLLFWRMAPSVDALGGGRGRAAARAASAAG